MPYSVCTGIGPNDFAQRRSWAQLMQQNEQDLGGSLKSALILNIHQNTQIWFQILKIFSPWGGAQPSSPTNTSPCHMQTCKSQIWTFSCRILSLPLFETKLCPCWERWRNSKCEIKKNWGFHRVALTIFIGVLDSSTYSYQLLGGIHWNCMWILSRYNAPNVS